MSALACDEELTIAELGSVLFSYESAFADRDKVRLAATANTLEKTLPCLRERLTPPDAARVHRMMGLGAFLEGERAAAVESFEAGRFLDPQYQFADGFVGEQHPLRTLYDGIPIDAPPSPRALLPPAEGWLMIDGKRAEEAPISRPFLFQRFDGEGRAVQTHLVAARSVLPAYPTVVERMGFRPIVTVGLGMLHYPNPSNTDVLGSVLAGLELPFGASLRAVFRGNAALAPASRVDPSGEKQSGLTGLWSARLGAMGVVGGEDGPRGLLGLQLVGFFHSSPLLTPGALFEGALEFPLPSDILDLRVSAEGGVTLPHQETDTRGIQPFGALHVGLVF